MFFSLPFILSMKVTKINFIEVFRHLDCKQNKIWNMYILFSNFSCVYRFTTIYLNFGIKLFKFKLAKGEIH